MILPFLKVWDCLRRGWAYLSACTAYPPTCTLNINIQLATTQAPLIMLYNMLNPNVHQLHKAWPQANTFHSCSSFVLQPESSEGISSTYTWSTSGIHCLFAFGCLLFFFFSDVPISESRWNFPPACRAVSQTAGDPELKVQEEEVLRPGVKQRAELSVYEAWLVYPPHIHTLIHRNRLYICQTHSLVYDIYGETHTYT